MRICRLGHETSEMAAIFLLREMEMESKLFQSGEQHGNAVLNFNHRAWDEFEFYAQAFHRAGVKMAENMISASGYNDLDACPIIFLYRHALELYLKAIGRIGQTILSLSATTQEISEKDLFGHKLTGLYPILRRVFSHVGWEWDLDVEGMQSFEELEELLAEFDRVDECSYTFRYPLDTKGKDSVPHHFVVNIPNFCSKIDKLLSALEGACIELRRVRYSTMEDSYSQCSNNDTKG